jgi:hypothetical protein
MIKDHLQIINPSTVLDVGAGAGKMGYLCREAVKHSRIDCIEPTESYIDTYKLNTIYNKVYNTSIQDFATKHCQNRYDLVIFGDILEHLFRSEAIDCLDFILYRTNWAMIVWPTNLPQDDWGDNTYEIHKSNFKLNDIASKFDVLYYKKKFLGYHNNNSEYPSYELNYCLMRGHAAKRNISL